MNNLFNSWEDQVKMLSEYDKYLQINETEKIIDWFDNHPNEYLTVYCPGSGSWFEQFHDKEQYLERMDAWNGGVASWILYKNK